MTIRDRLDVLPRFDISSHLACQPGQCCTGENRQGITSTAASFSRSANTQWWLLHLALCRGYGWLDEEAVYTTTQYSCSADENLQCYFKWAHTVYFSSSLYIINQKPMIPLNSFSFYNHMSCTLFWLKFVHAFAYFVVLVY